MAARSGKVDGLIARIAGRQHGAVGRPQLLAAAITRHEIQRRIDSGALIPIHPGVYLVGHRGGSPWAPEAAALLACGTGAMLSHRTAARIWRLPAPNRHRIEITVAGRRPRPPRGVSVYSVTALHPSERRRRHNLPVTSPALTLLDLAGVLSDEDLAAALNESRVLRLVREEALEATPERHSQRRGAAALRRLLSAEQGLRITRSEAERRALRLMRAHGLEPETNVRIGPWRVDFLFRAEDVVVEVDGYRYHSTPKRFVDDRRRAADLAARGLVVFSLTWNDLGPEGTAAMTRLDRTLERRRAS